MTVKRKLSATQLRVLCALNDLNDLPELAARDVAAETGQSTDGAAYTLRSLVRRKLAVIDSHDGDAARYRLTDAGKAEVQADAARRASEQERFWAWLAARTRQVTERQDTSLP